MGSVEPNLRRAPAPRGQFATTQWGLVAAAGGETTAESRDALAALFEQYWYPIYVYIRRRGYRADEAEDLAQAFFTMLLERKSIRQADRRRGRFRSYLLGALQNFLASELERASAVRRGGGRRVVSLDPHDAEGRLKAEPVEGHSPERLFDRQWALTVLNLAIARLREQWSKRGKSQAFERLHGCMTAGRDSDARYADLAAELGMSAGAVKVAVHRMRREYGELVRRQIAQTVESASDVDEEVRHLFTALRG